MEREANTRPSMVVSDAELLRTIGQGVRAVYAEIIKEPLPHKLEVTLARIECEQSRVEHRSQ